MRLRNKRLSKIPKPYIKSGCRSFYVRLTTADGKRREINLGTIDKKEARIRARREVEHLNSQLDGTFGKVVDLQHMVQEYFMSKVNMRPSSLKRSKQHIEFFLRYIHGHHPDTRHLNQIGVYHISGFQSCRLRDKTVQGKVISPKTVRESLYVVNNLFEWAIKRNYARENPVRKVDVVTAPRKDQHVFTDEELLKILAHCSQSVRHGFMYPAYLTLITTGMRSGELTHLTWEDIDFERRFIKIRTKTLPNGQEWTAKTKQNRELKMDDEVYKVLMSLKSQSQSEWAFVNTKGRRQTELMLLQNLKVICDMLGIPIGQVHSFRRSFACMMDKAVKDRVAIKEILGHATMTMTDRYCSYRPKEYIDKAHLKTTAEFIKKLKAVEKMAK